MAMTAHLPGRHGWRIAVDFIGCDGRGVCAELFPERITLDDWGYPIIDPTPIDRHHLADARRAVSGCPKLALRLESVAHAKH
jgi:ferredoxin